MSTRNTDPRLIRGIEKVLRQFNKDGDFDSHIPGDLTTELRECFTAQAHIGWVGFLEGIISTKWATYQNLYYKKIGSRRSGSRWATDLSKQLWKGVFAMWDHRNNALFATDTLDRMSGIDKVKLAITYERNIGLGTLDDSFSPYFDLPTASFKKMKSINLRRWLSLIRQARKEQGYEYADEFVTSFALRDWIGLAVLPQHLRNHQQRQDRRHQEMTLRRLRTGYRD